ncbi:hypothetical protein NM688_g8375 [Phlebia brevispora]|uniref:Uncharacterized protein n=1 Tax=Phlebia brevispora TaxID=194682 RepID=A0ACC1RS33_9APHY|nr:hypothetical protein NM688_g8375 [Phlebia brevispora]
MAATQGEDSKRVTTAKKPFVIPQFTAKDYSSFFLAGALCATLTHGAMTPIDVVKTRIQIDPAFKKLNLFSGTRYIVATEGPAALLTGFGPTAVGYLVQGGGKFAGYEFWKKQFSQIAGDQETAVKYRTAIYLSASSVGEYVLVLLHDSAWILTPMSCTGSSPTSCSRP